MRYDAAIFGAKMSGIPQKVVLSRPLPSMVLRQLGVSDAWYFFCVAN